VAPADAHLEILLGGFSGDARSEGNEADGLKKARRDR
jgi:hypothetical protein